MGASEIKKLAMIGCGSMGGGMALLFAENGVEVSLQDPSEEAMDGLIEAAEKQGLGGHLKKYTDYESLCGSLDDTKVFVFSLPHGTVGDSVLGGLTPYLRKGDVIIDCGNEHYANTERRQGKCTVRGIEYIGCGVSGGYQAARAGPSMCPGGSDKALDYVLPLLQTVAAKDKNGNACVAKVGTGGCGHHVKMVHNGIEHGMMSAVAEAYNIMYQGLGMDLDDIGNTFEKWDKEGPLRGTFLISIGADICRTKDDQGNRVVESVEDKVVQDITGEEGTGIWSNEEAISHHIPAPTLNIAHDPRLASADRQQRVDSQKAFGGEFPHQKISLSGEDKKKFVKALEQAVYAACLASYIQGMNIIERADVMHGWHIDYISVLQIWKAGCIIQADHISDMLKPILDKYQEMKTINLLLQPNVMTEMRDALPSLREVVKTGVANDWVVPSLGASLEYVKYQTGTDLPTAFYEAELDFFGKHMFDKKGEKGTGAPTEGKHHFEWRPAKGSDSRS